MAFAVLYAALERGSVTRTSATFDEPGGLLAGYAALAERDYRPAVEHPPLLRMWTALPLLWLPDVAWNGAAIDRAAPADVAFPGPFGIGQHFLYVRNDADRLLYAGRSMTTVIGVALGVVLFCWMLEWLGFRAAVIALALYTVEPNLAAHAGLVTNDLGVTAFMFASVYFLWRLGRGGQWTWNAAGLVACVAAAVLSKFSAILLAPMLLVLMALSIRRRQTLTMRSSLGLIGLMIAVIWIGAWAAYGFRYEPSATPGWRFALQDLPAVRQAVPTLAAIVDRVDAWQVLPNAFTQGFLHGQGLVQARPAFLAGQYSSTGWWYYFPAAFAMKTPIALLLLFGAGLLMAARRRGLAPGGVAFVVVPIVVFGGLAMTSSLNIGLRHILPIYPFVIMLAAMAAEWPIDALGSRRGTGTVAVLLVLAAAEFGRAYPSSLSFFNAAVGGPSRGYAYLADSNIDWGQDLKPLKAWMDRQGVDHINLAYFGVADPAYYRMNYTPIWGTTLPNLAPGQIGPPKLPGYVAVSVTLLNGVPFPARERDFYKPLRDREPAADIGGSSRGYWVETPGWPARP